MKEREGRVPVKSLSLVKISMDGLQQQKCLENAKEMEQNSIAHGTKIAAVIFR